MQLTTEQRIALVEALLATFPTYSALDRGALTGLGQRLESISSSHSLQSSMVELVRWVESTGRTLDLLRAARRENPENRDLQELEARLFPSSNADASAPDSAITRAQLHEILLKRFSSEELGTLCFDLGIDYENLGGRSRISRARELIVYLERRGRLDDLIRFIRQQYPDIDLSPAVKPAKRPPLSVQRRPVPPAPRADFVGRERELAWIGELLSAGAAGRAIVLVGMGGIGKTAIAAQAAARLDNMFPGGTIWSTLGPAADAGNILAAWAQAIGADVLRGPDAEQKVLAELESWQTSHGRLLFVLDDLQSEQLGQTLLRAIPEQGKVLITTRDRGLGAALGVEGLDVQPLLEDTARYFIDRAIGGVKGDQARAVEQLVDLSGGHPLALAIIANLASRTHDLMELARRLSRQPAVLGLEAAPAANVTLDAALRLTYEALDELMQQRFRRLGVFENLRFDIATVAAVWEEPTLATSRALDRLIASALVSRVDDEHYVLHPALAEFTRSELSRKGELAEARLQHASHYLSIVQGREWRAIEANLPQIRIAWVTALSAGGELLTSYLIGAGSYFTQRGQWRELQEWAQTAHSAIGEGEEALRLACLSCIGRALLNLARLDEARSAFEQQRELAGRAGDQMAEANALVGLGSIARIRNQYPQSQSQLDQARALLVAASRPAALTGVLVELALLARVRGDYVTAIHYLEESLTNARQAGDRLAEATALHFIGVLYRVRGDLVQALPYYQQSLAIAEEFGDEQGRAKTLNTIGDIYRDQRRFEEARTYFEQSLAIVRASGSRMQEAESLQNLGRLLRAQGRTDEALAILDQAAAIWQEIGDRAGLALLLNDSGLTLHGAGRRDEARERFERALSLARETGNPGDAALALSNLAIVAGDQGDWQGAERLYDEVLVTNRGLRDRAGEAAALAGLGRVATHMQQGERAVELYRQVVSISQETGDRAGEAAALVNIGDLLLEQNRFDEAHTTYQAALIIQQLLSDTAGISRTRQQLDRIEILHEATLAPLLTLASEAQRFFEEAGFLVTPAGTLSFQCRPVNQLWRGRLPSTIYSEIVVGKLLDYAAVLNVRGQARRLTPSAGAAFVMIDEGVTNDALTQIELVASFR